MPTPLARRIPWYVVGLLLGLAANQLLLGAVDHDEVFHLHLSWQAFRGVVPYRDIFARHGIAFYYLLAPLHALTEDPLALVRLARGINGLALLVTCAATFVAGRSLLGEPAALLGLCFMLFDPFRVGAALEVRPDPLYLCLLMLCILLLATPRERGPGTYALAGALLGLSTTLIQKGIYGFIALSIPVAWSPHGDAAQGLVPASGAVRRLAAYACGYIAVLLAFLVWLAWLDCLQGFWDFAIRLNAAYVTHLPLRHLDYSFYFQAAPHIWVLGAVGLVLPGLPRAARLTLAVPSLIFLALLFASRAPYRQYYLPVWPAMSLLAAHVFLAAVDAARRFTAGRWAPAVLVALLLALLAVRPGVWLFYYRYGVRATTLDWFRNVSHIVVNNTPPGQPVFDPADWFNISRPSLHFYWTGTSWDFDDLKTTFGRDVRPDWPRLLAAAGPRFASDLQLRPEEAEFVHRHYVPTCERFLLVAGVSLATAPARGSAGVPFELIATGRYRLVPALAARGVAIDGKPCPSALMDLKAGRHVLTATGNAPDTVLVRLDYDP